MQVIRANAIGKVIRSKDTNFSEGDIVTTYMFPVAEFCVMPINWLQKINPTIGITLPDYLSCLGKYLTLLSYNSSHSFFKSTPLCLLVATIFHLYVFSLLLFFNFMSITSFSCIQIMQSYWIKAHSRVYHLHFRDIRYLLKPKFLFQVIN